MNTARLVRSLLGDPEITWAIGTLGAIAEFSCETDEPVFASDKSVTTVRGGVRLADLDQAIPLAWERPVANGRWIHGVTLCLPAESAAMHRRIGVTELGADSEALHPADREAILFDLGIGALHCDICIRTANAELLHHLRSAEGKSLFESGLVPRLIDVSPDRVFMSRLGRIEVRTRIPAHDGSTPDGPHTHVLPQLLKLGRSHPATLPLPQNTYPCAEFFPPAAWQVRPGANSSFFDRENYARFQKLLEQFGDADCLRAKRETMAAVRAGKPPFDQAEYTRKQRLARRVALRQLKQIDEPTDVLADWIRTFDRPS